MLLYNCPITVDNVAHLTRVCLRVGHLTLLCSLVAWCEVLDDAISESQLRV